MAGLISGQLLLFYAISGKLVVFVILSSLSIHHFVLWLEHIDHQEETRKIRMKQKRKVLLFAILLHMGLLVVLKYMPFFLSNLNQVAAVMDYRFHGACPRYALPIGLSFYTLQAVSYMVDVYRGQQKADPHLGRICLYLAFFPQIMEGPIARYRQTADQLYAGRERSLILT